LKFNNNKHVSVVLSHLWGKRQRLEIHLNAVNHSMLVRIPNEFICNKVIQKKLWYIGECMFLVAKWDSSGGASQDLDAIPIWAHLKRMPFNLMHRKGISLVAGLIGDPKERDEFTMNLVSLTEAHVKVEANLNNPLPFPVEVFRDDGSVINIDVVYPWVPPTCSNCNMLGHVIRFCPSLPPPSATARPSGLKKNTEKDKGKGKVSGPLHTTDGSPPGPNGSHVESPPSALASSSSIQTPVSEKESSKVTFGPQTRPVDFIPSPPIIDLPTIIETSTEAPIPLNNSKPLSGAIKAPSPPIQTTISNFFATLASCSSSSLTPDSLILNNSTPSPGSQDMSDDDGRIVIIFKQPTTISIIRQSKQFLTCHITIPGGHSFFFTAVYASNLRAERTDLWCELIHIQHSLSLGNCPWVVCGDFNQITHPLEHSDPAVDHIASDMLEMRDCMMQLDLFVLRYQGPTFTWTNKQPADPCAKKLDRLLVNNHWLSNYPDSAASFLAPDFSDHAPCLLNLAFPLPLAGTKPFKFFNHLTKHPSFLPLIENAWIQAGASLHQGTCLSLLCAKQKTLKRELIILTKEFFSDIQKRVRETSDLLLSVQEFFPLLPWTQSRALLHGFSLL
ncbi:unnamed protein product, partial [Thlaspi arvense]